MAKTCKNNNKRSIKQNSKHGVAKKSSIEKNSADQKENRPKKINKSNINEEIPMSKQLLMKKKTVQNKSRTKRQTKCTIVCGNGKIMPSLADLEKMFEDSDDDCPEPTPNKTKREPPSTPQKPMSTVIDVDTILSPSTRTRITNQVKEILFNINDDSCIYPDNITGQPPKKQLKFEPQQPVTTLTEDYNTDLLMNNDQVDSSQTETNNLASRLEPIVNEKNQTIDSGNISDNSCDSNNTIEYQLNPSILKSGAVSQLFCPLPSTSKDSDTFIKNDELFNKSLQASSLSYNKLIQSNSLQITEKPTEPILKTEQLPINMEGEIINSDQINETPMETHAADVKAIENEDKDVQIIEIPIETILIDDETQNNVNSDTNIMNSNDHRNEILIDPDEEDNDCIFVEAQDHTANQKMTTTTSDIIDLEYEFVEPINKTEIIDDEIIDVDDLIAENQTTLEQYKKPELKENITNVVDVNVATIIENKNDTSNQHTFKRKSEEATNNVDITQNIPQSATHHPDVYVDDATVSHSTNNLHINNMRETIHQNRQTTHPPLYNDIRNVFYSPQCLRQGNSYNTESITRGVEYFFKNIYRPSSTYESGDPHHLDKSNNLGWPIIQALRSTFICSGNHKQHNKHRTSSNHRQQHSSPSSLTHSITNLLSTPGTPIAIKTIGDILISRSDSKKKCTRTERNNNIGSSQNLPAEEKTSRHLGDCPICMDTLSGKAIASTICGHVFCMQCLKQAITANKRCPTCRKILKKNGYHQIFL